jgi:hypothetical protein
MEVELGREVDPDWACAEGGSRMTTAARRTRLRLARMPRSVWGEGEELRFTGIPRRLELSRLLS